MKSIIIFLIIIFFNSCVSLTSFRNPEILKKDESIFGIGNSSRKFEENDIIYFNPNLWYRFSTTNKTDFGLKFGLYDGIEIDYKINLLDEYVNIAGDLSLSYNEFLYTNPMVLIGNKNIYGGYRYSIALIPTDEELYSSYIVGLSYTMKKTTLMSEVIFWKETDAKRIFITIGLGIQFHF